MAEEERAPVNLRESSSAVVVLGKYPSTESKTRLKVDMSDFDREIFSKSMLSDAIRSVDSVNRNVTKIMVRLHNRILSNLT